MGQKATRQELEMFKILGRTCNNCGVLKPWNSDFFRKTRNGFTGTCKSCAEQKYPRNKERIKEKNLSNALHNKLNINNLYDGTPKKCGECKDDLFRLFKHFGKCYSRRDGLENRCRRCKYQRQKLYRQRNPHIKKNQYLRAREREVKNNPNIKERLNRIALKKDLGKDLKAFKLRRIFLKLYIKDMKNILKYIRIERAYLNKVVGHTYQLLTYSERNCIVCDSKFMPSHKSHYICSQKCRMIRIRNRYIDNNKKLGDLVYDNSLKECQNCKRILPRNKSNFMKCESFKDGLWSYCGICRKDKDKKRTCYKTRKLLDSHSSKCYYCGDDLIWGSPRNWDMEHKIPLSRGGSDDESNIVPSCPDCNKGKPDSKYTMTDIEYLEYRRSKGLKINPERNIYENS